MNNKIEPGDVVVDQWGYDQTNVDFYLVLARTAKFATLVVIGQGVEYDAASMTGRTVPDVETRIGEPFRKGVVVATWNRLNDEVVTMKPGRRSAGKWDGRPVNYSDYA